MVYKVGDEVEITVNLMGAERGEICTIVCFDDKQSPIGVRFNKYSGMRHSCDGLCECGYGYWVAENWIKPFSIDDETIVQYANRKLERMENSHAKTW